MISHIRVQELAEKQKQGEPVYLVDVRQPWEAELCQLPDSVLIPLAELPARLSEVQPPDGAMIAVYCHHGVRSMSGASLLQEAGFANVASLVGGIDAWSQRVDPKVPRY